MDKVVHFEIPFDDQERAKQFYSHVFGWQIVPMPEMNYVIARSVEVDENQMPKESGAINGGMFKRNEQMSKTPVLVLDVKSIDEKIQQVQANGGSVFMNKTPIGDMGFYAQIKDPEGNIIGLFETVKKQEGQPQQEQATGDEPQQAEASESSSQ